MESFKSRQEKARILEKMDKAWWSYQDKWNCKPDFVFVSYESFSKIHQAHMLKEHNFQHCELLNVNDGIGDEVLFYESSDLDLAIKSGDKVIEKFSSAVSKNLGLAIPDSILDRYKCYLNRDK